MRDFVKSSGYTTYDKRAAFVKMGGCWVRSLY